MVLVTGAASVAAPGAVDSLEERGEGAVFDDGDGQSHE